MAKDRPDHHDAELALRAYELRRDPSLREARRVVTRELWPTSVDDLKELARWDHPQNEAFRQVTGYWELVFGMARHGIVDPEYFAETAGGEALILLAKLHPFLAEFRDATGPTFLSNTEWIATQTEYGRQTFDRLQREIERMRDAR